MNDAGLRRIRPVVRQGSVLAMILFSAFGRADAQQSPPTVVQIVEEGRAARREVMRLLDRARIERDIVKVTCYDAKLSGINAMLRPIETGAGPWRPAVLRSSRERIRTLVQQAHECVCVYPAWTDGPGFHLEVRVDPRIPTEDPSGFPAS